MDNLYHEIAMALHPLREALGLAGLNAFHNESTFKSDANAVLAQFQAIRDDLERQVKRGDLTVKVAREKAEAAAVHLKAELARRVDSHSSVPRVFLDRLIDASNARKRSRDHLSIEGLQRETNQLLRQNLIEQQLQNRAKEFEGKTYVRSFSGGQPAPTLDSLLAFHQTTIHAGDEAGQEWARRQLESIRTWVSDPADQRRIDLACDRPEAVNSRLVASYLEALQNSEPEMIEPFIENALESRDANACVAAFLLAREEPRGTAVRWVRDVLNNMVEFPDAALATLRSIEAEDRNADAEGARAQADYAIALAEAQVRFSDVEAPTDEELARSERLRSRPVARLGEPIGLALDRRGFGPEELAEHISLETGDQTE